MFCSDNGFLAGWVFVKRFKLFEHPHLILWIEIRLMSGRGGADDESVILVIKIIYD